MKDRVFQGLVEAARNAEPVALGVISRAKGSSPQKCGAKALFYSDGRITGTLGGGCLEAEVQRRALEALRTGKPAAFDLVLDHDFGWDDGLICGGKVEGLIVPNAQGVGEGFWWELGTRMAPLTWGIRSDFSISFLEGTPKSAKADTGENDGASKTLASDLDRNQGLLYWERVSPPCAFWIAGAGHIAQAVAPLAGQLDFAVTVFDDRPALASPRFFPDTIALRADVWEKLLSLPLPSTPTFGLIVTRGHRHDALVLRDWLRKPFVFLGMIGSERKARIITEHFIAEHLATPTALSRVACPVGLDIGSQTVPEIAVSIMAQFIQKRAELVNTP